MSPASDTDIRPWIRGFREPVMLMLVALVMLANVVPRNWMFGVRTRETMASDAAWGAGNRAGGLALLMASAVWIAAAAYLPRPWVKPVGIAALLLAVAALFMTQGWSF